MQGPSTKAFIEDPCQGRAHDYRGAGAQSQKRAICKHQFFVQALITQYVD